MKKTYEVFWTESFICSKVVEAESEDEALEMCYDIDDPDKRRFEEYSGWSVREV